MYAWVRLKYLILLQGLLCSFSASAIPFNDFMLNALVESPDYHRKVIVIKGFLSDVEAAKSDFYPQIDFTTGVSYAEVNHKVVGNNKPVTVITLSQNFFRGFSTMRTVEVQKSRVRAQAFNAFMQANDVAMNILESYLNLKKQEKVLHLAKLERSNRIEVFKKFKGLRKSGIGNKSDVEALIESMQVSDVEVAKAQRNVEAARALFNEVVGEKLSKDYLSIEDPKVKFDLPATLEEAIKIGLKNSPALKTSVADSIVERNKIKVAQSKFYPRIDFTIKEMRGTNLSGLEGRNQYLAANLNINYNIFSGGLDKASLDDAENRYRYAKEIIKFKKRSVVKNIKNAWYAVEFYKYQLKKQKFVVNMKYKTVLLYKKQVKLGRHSILHLLNAQSDYNHSQSELENIKNNLLIAKYKLIKEMGLLLPAFNIRLDIERFCEGGN